MISTQVRAHGAEPLEARQFQGAVDKIIRQHTKTLRKDVRLSAGAEIVVAAGELALLMAAAKRRASGGLGLGAYAAFRAALLQYQRGLRETTKVAGPCHEVGRHRRDERSVAAMAYGDPRRRRTRPRAASARPSATSPSSTDRH